MIAVIDYGLGNLFSLVCSLKYLGETAEVTADPTVIAKADKLILPGVGAFGDAMARLNGLGLADVLRQQAADGKPLLGICLGMQLLFEKSEEFGVHQGLGLLPGRVVSLAADLAAAGSTLKTPQMGWNALDIRKPDCPVLANCRQGDHVYFVHSFYAKDCYPVLAASVDYQVTVPATVWKDNVFGCQFHPEKSGRTGLGILDAYIKGVS